MQMDWEFANWVAISTIVYLLIDPGFKSIGLTDNCFSNIYFIRTNFTFQKIGSN